MSISASVAAALNVANLTSPVSVADSAANVATYLDGLGPLATAGKLSAVTLTDSGTPDLTIAASQLSTDAAVLLLVANTAWTLTQTGTLSAAQAAGARSSLLMKLSAGLAVSDTAADVVDSLAGLQSHAPWIASITLTDNPANLTLGAAQLVTDAAALQKIAGTYAITVTGAATAAQAAAANTTLLCKVTDGLGILDSAADIAAVIDTLEARFHHISAITLTDPTPVLSLTAQQLVADASILQKIDGTYTISVSGDATAAQAASVRNALIVKVKPGLTVADSASNVVSNLAELQSHAPWINQIVLTDPTPVLSLTATQLVSDSAALVKIFGTYAIAVSGTANAQQAASVNSMLVAKLSGGLAVVDTAADVVAVIDQLQAHAAAIASITLTDTAPALSITAAQAANDAAALLKIGTGFTLTLTTDATAQQAAAMRASLLNALSAPLHVTDSAADVAVYLAGLQSHAASIASITLTDSAPVLSISAQQLTADATALLRIAGPYTISLTGSATVAQVTAAYGSLISRLSAGFAVSDSAANVSAGIDALQARAGTIASVTLTDTAPVLDITATQLLNDAAALQKITGSYAIDVSGTATAAQFASIRQALIVKLNPGITIQDSASDVIASLPGLQAYEPWLNAIELTDSSPVLSLSAAQMISGGAVLSKITGTYTLTALGDVTAQQVGEIPLAELAVLSGGLSVSDSVTNVEANLAALQVNAGHISSIALTDPTPVLTLTGSQLAADANVLSLISGNYAVSVTSPLTASQAEGLQSYLSVAGRVSGGLAVSDSAVNILASLSGLQGLGGVLGSISVTGSPSDVTVTAAQLQSYGAVLQKLSGPGVLAVSGTLSAAQAAGMNPALLRLLTAGLAVSDSAGNVASGLDGLEALGSRLASITLTDQTPAISISAATLAADYGALAKISGQYALTVTGTLTVSQFLALPAQVTANLQGQLSLSDSATNVVGALPALAADSGLIAGITLTGTNPQLAVTTAQLVADGAVLAKITGSYSLSVSGSALTVQQVLSLPFGVTNHLTAGLSVADSATAVATSLAALETLSGSIASVTLTDESPVLTLTAAQMISDAAVLLAITGPYAITQSGVASIAQATQINTTLRGHVSGGLAITDSLTNLMTGLSALQGLGSQVGSIVLTDTSPTISVDAATLAADAGTLGKITSVYTLTVTSGTLMAAQAASLPADVASSLSPGVQVSDSAAQVAANLDGLQALGRGLASISLIDPTPVLTITAAQFSGDSGALYKISAPFQIAVSDAATVAEATGADTTLLGDLTSALVVSDTASLVSANLSSLASLGSHLASITLTDSTPAMSVTAATLLAQEAVLAKISTPYSLTVSGAISVADAIALPTAVIDALSGSLAISDASTAVAGDLDQLQAINGAIGPVTLTDGNTPTLSINVSSLAADAPILGKIIGPYQISLLDDATVTQALTVNPGLLPLVSGGLAISDTAGAVSSGIDRLQGISSFISGIAVSDGLPVDVTAAQLISDSGALLKLSNGAAIAVTGTANAQQATEASTTLLSQLSTGLAISDLAGNVASALDSLETRVGAIGSITLTDTPAVLSISATQLVQDSAVLLKISGPYQISVVGDAPTAEQAASLVGSLLLAHLSAPLTVNDSAANVVHYLNGLQSLGSSLGTVTLTDGGTPMLSIDSAVLLNDAGALGQIAGSYAITVTGSSVTMQPLINLGTALLSHITSGLTIADTAAHIAPNLGVLQGLGTAVASVTLSDVPPVLYVTATELSQDAGILQTIIGGGATLAGDPTNASPISAAAALGDAPAYTGTLQFTGPAADVATTISSLQALQTAGHLGTITVTDGGSLSFTAAQLVTYAAVLDQLSGSCSVAVTSGTLTVAQFTGLGSSLISRLTSSVTIHDSGSAIVSGLSSLETGLAAIASVSFTDASPPTLTLTPASMVSGLGVLNLATGYSISISGTFTAQQAAQIAGSPASANLVVGAAVSDTGAAVSANLNSLETLATAGLLGPITLTDSSPPVLTLTPDQLMNDVAVLRKITSSYTLDPGTLTAQQATGVNSLLVSKLPATLVVADTAANIFTHLDQLQTLAAGNHLGSISLTDTGTPELEVTADQLTSDANALALIGGTYTLQIVGGITAAQAASYADNPAQLATPISVEDSSSDVVTSLAGLQTLAAAGKLALITFTDSGTPTLSLTAAQFAGDSAALQTVLGSYTVTLSTAMGAQQFLTVSEYGLLSRLTATPTIDDYSYNVQPALDMLEAWAGHISTITFIDNTTTSITITSAQLGSDAAVLKKLADVQTITLSDDPAVAQVTGADPTLKGMLRSLVVSDSAANIAGSLDALEAMAAQISSIQLTGGASITITTSQLQGDATVLDMVHGLETITISDQPSIGDVLAADTHLEPMLAGLNIQDSANNVLTNLGSLEGIAGQINSIALSGGVHTLAITTAELDNDQAALDKLAGGLTSITISGNPAVADVIGADATIQPLLSGLNIVDTAAHVVLNLDTLATLAPQINAITLESGVTTIAITTSQLDNDQAALDKLAGALTSITISDNPAVADVIGADATIQPLLSGLNIVDTAANVVGSINTLETLAPQINAIGLENGVTSIAISTFQLDHDAAALDKLAGALTSITISDNPAVADVIGADATIQPLLSGLNIQDIGSAVFTNLGTLEQLNPRIASIIVTDDPSFSLTAAEVLADQNVLEKIQGTWGLDITDSITNVATALAIPATLLSHLDVRLTIDATAADLEAQIDNLDSIVSSIGTITLSGNPVVTVTPAQLVNDAAVLNLISPVSYTLQANAPLTASQFAGLPTNVQTVLDNTRSLAIAATAADIGTNLDSLQANAAAIGSITVTDNNPLTISAATLANDWPVIAIAQDTNAAPAAITVSDTLAAAQIHFLATESSAVTGRLTGPVVLDATSAEVAGSMTDLLTVAGLQTSQSQPALASITLTDALPAFSLATADLLADRSVLTLIGNPYALTVSGTIAVADLESLPQMILGNLTAGLAVYDTSAHVQSALDTLNQSFASATGTISFSDNAPAMSISADTLENDLPTLEKINGHYALTVTGSLDVASLEALPGSITGNLVGGIDIQDTAANVDTALDWLQQHASVVGSSITLSDSGTPVLDMTATTLSDDYAVLAKITTPYSIDVTSGGITAATAAALAGDALVSHLSGAIAIDDSTAHMVGNLPALQQLATAGVLGIVTTTTAPAAINVTASEAENDPQAINAVLGAQLANAHPELFIEGTSGTDTINAGGFASITNITLGSNGAALSFTQGTAAVAGGDNTITLGSAVATVNYAVGSGVEVINDFNFGTHLLDITLDGGTSLTSSDVTYGNQAAILIQDAVHQSAQGVLLVNPGLTASDLSTDHLFVAGNQALIS